MISRKILSIVLIVGILFIGIILNIDPVSAPSPSPSIDAFRTTSTVTPQTLDFPIVTLSSNDIMLLMVNPGYQPGVLTISDNQGLTWTLRKSLTINQNKLVYYTSRWSGSGFIDVQVAIAGSPNPCNSLPICAGFLFAVKDVNTVSPFDVSPSVPSFATGQITGGGPQTIQTQITTYYDYDLIIGICAGDGYPNYCQTGSGYTSNANQSCGENSFTPTAQCINVEFKSVSIFQNNLIIPFNTPGNAQYWAVIADALVGVNAIQCTTNCNPLPGGGDTGTGQQYLFYDDFRGAHGSPEKWSPFRIQNNPLTIQSNGRLIIVAKSGNFTALIANITEPVISSSFTNGTFIFAVWKLSISNMTQDTVVTNGVTGKPASRLYIVNIGLINDLLSPWFVGFHIVQYENPVQLKETQKIKIGAEIITKDPNCFGITSGDICSVNQRYAVPMSSGQMSISPGEHYFTMQMKLYPQNAVSWIDFEVDGDMHYNFTDTSCNCIKFLEHAPWYPYINNEICMVEATIECGGIINTSPHRSVATSVAYVLVANYIPTTLPPGSPVYWDIPAFANPLDNSTPDIGNILQYAAFSLSPDHPAFGGAIVTMIFIAVALSFTIMTGIRFPFIYTIEILGILLLCLTLSIIPLWIALSAIIIQLGSAMGLYSLAIRRDNV